MRAVVKPALYNYLSSHEGYTPFLYADKYNLVTTGIGFLADGSARNTVDTSEHAITGGTVNPLTMQWFHKGDGWTPKNPVTADPASDDEVRAAWIAVKTAGMQLRGGFAYADTTNLSLSIQGIQDTFYALQDGFESELRGYFPTWDSWPADAQLATMIMSWAMGPAFPRKFPRFASAANALDFTTAAQESFYEGGGGTLDNRQGRNADTYAMFLNAASSVGSGGDPDILFFDVSPAGPSLGRAVPSAAAQAARSSLPWLPVLTVAGAIFGGTLLMKGRP